MPRPAQGIAISLQEKLRISKFQGGWDFPFSSSGGPATWRRINYGAINGLSMRPRRLELITVIYVVSNLVKTFHDYDNSKFQLYCRCPEL